MLSRLRCVRAMASPAAPAASTSSSSKASQGQIVEKALIRSDVPLIDIGVNLSDPSFHKDTADVVDRARRAGVAAIVVTGCSLASARAAQQLVDSTLDYPLYFTAGVHPHNAKECDGSTLEELRALAAHPRCVAVGECGLDFNRNFSPPDVQEEWFDKQVGLAVELRKPLFMHCRDAGDKFAEVLGRHSLAGLPAVLHCFTGNGTELAQCLQLGLSIGITGWVCDDRPERGGAELAALLPSIPADRLMIETDAPYLVPRTIKPNKARPGRNEPALLPHVLQQVAASLGQEPAEVAARTTRNACRFFGLPLPEGLQAEA